MNKHHLTLICWLAGYLSACSMAPPLTIPDLPLENSYPTHGDMNKPVNDNPTIARLEHHAFFRDPYLQQLIDTALVNNRDLRTAMARVEQARIQYDIQAVKQLPAISGNAGYAATRTSRELTAPTSPLLTHVYQVNVGITAFELDFFGRLESLKDMARAQFLATMEAAQTARLVLMGEVANAYYDEQAAAEQLTLAEDVLSSRRDVYALSQQRFNHGIIPESDLNINKSLVHAAEIAVADGIRQHGQAVNALQFLLGCIQPLRQSLHKTVVEPVTDIDPELPSALLQNRPDIRQAEQLLRAANANIGAARAAFFPTIALTTTIGTASQDLNHLFQASTRTWNFVPFLSVPLFDWGNNINNLDLAELRKEMSIVDYERAIQNAFREVADALVARDGLNAQYKAQQEYTRTLTQQLKLVQLRYDHGIANEIDVFTVKQQTFKAQQDLVQIKYARLKNLATLYKVLGGGQVY